MYELQKWLNDLELYNMDVDLVITSFTHSSFKGIESDVEYNERIEFLGDSVLDLIMAEM